MVFSLPLASAFSKLPISVQTKRQCFVSLPVAFSILFRLFSVAQLLSALCRGFVSALSDAKSVNMTILSRCCFAVDVKETGQIVFCNLTPLLSAVVHGVPVVVCLKVPVCW